jgi:fructokinase
MIFGGIEAGGTKFVCGIGNSEGEILDHVQISTTLPAETLSRVIEYFESIRNEYKWQRIGLASFGPLDLNPHSKTYGYITSTPKARWRDFDLRGALVEGLGTEVDIDTDVNGAGLAEYKWGAAKGKSPVVYLTVGTGIGGGVIIDGKPLHGLVHPEIGHMRISREDPPSVFAGVCPYHGDCLEGLASGVALSTRWGVPGYQLPQDHEGWEFEAAYLAAGVANLVLTLSPEIIILGGGVMKNDFLFPMIRAKVKQLLNGYVQKNEVTEPNDSYIVAPGLKTFSGLMGAVALASLNRNPV